MVRKNGGRAFSTAVFGRDHDGRAGFAPVGVAVVDAPLPLLVLDPR